MPNILPNELLNSGKIANKLTKIQKIDHKTTVEREFLLFRYLPMNQIMAMMEIMGTIKAYKNIFSPFRIDV